MKIEEIKTYNFSFPFDGINYNFSINAGSQSEAVDRLLQGLSHCVEELKGPAASLSKPH